VCITVQQTPSCSLPSSASHAMTHLGSDLLMPPPLTSSTTAQCFIPGITASRSTTHSYTPLLLLLLLLLGSVLTSPLCISKVFVLMGLHLIVTGPPATAPSV